MLGMFSKAVGRVTKRHGATRRKGITALISCQDEEMLIASSIVSFLRVADEIIVVDNGSIDMSKAYAREVAEAFPDRVFFYEDDSLQHLYENRQYGLERSTGEWIIRVDSDYVCYTEGPNDVVALRHALANWQPSALIDILRMTRVDVWFDFFHVPSKTLDVYGKRHPENAPMDRRVYKWFPEMRFERMGRWEGVPLPKEGVAHHDYKTPHWMHCDVKSDHNHFMRSERTNWRELGDFGAYPTLRSYIESVILEKYGTDDFDVASRVYIDRMLRKDSEVFDVARFGAYPALVQMLLDQDVGYGSFEKDGLVQREKRNLPDIAKVIDAGRKIHLG